MIRYHLIGGLAALALSAIAASHSPLFSLDNLVGGFGHLQAHLDALASIVIIAAAVALPFCWRLFASQARRGAGWCLRLMRDVAMAMKQRSGPLVRRQSDYGPVWA